LVESLVEAGWGQKKDVRVRRACELEMTENKNEKKKASQRQDREGGTCNKWVNNNINTT
jgi:hypothetical protein